MTQPALIHGIRRKREPIPEGCRICRGEPFVSDGKGSRRCTCLRGAWYQMRDKARKGAL